MNIIRGEKHRSRRIHCQCSQERNAVESASITPYQKPPPQPSVKFFNKKNSNSNFEEEEEEEIVRDKGGRTVNIYMKRRVEGESRSKLGAREDAIADSVPQLRNARR